MRSHITTKGELVIVACDSTEQYALDRWYLDNKKDPFMNLGGEVHVQKKKQKPQAKAKGETPKETIAETKVIADCNAPHIISGTIIDKTDRIDITEVVGAKNGTVTLELPADLATVETKVAEKIAGDTIKPTTKIAAKKSPIDIPRKEMIKALEAFGVPVLPRTHTTTITKMLNDCQEKVDKGLDPITGEPISTQEEPKDIPFPASSTTPKYEPPAMIAIEDVFSNLDALSNATEATPNLAKDTVEKFVGHLNISTITDQNEINKLHLFTWELVNADDTTTACERYLSTGTETLGGSE